MINSQQESFIKNLVQSSSWHIIENLAKEVVNKIKEESILRDTNEDTLKEALLQEGRVQGIKQLLQEIYFIGTK